MGIPSRTASLVALLGRRDQPTDAVEQYCEQLGAALRERGVGMEVVRVPWAEQGWWKALRWLREESKPWSGHWVFVQYTALAWSQRGFPVGLLAVLWILKQRRTRVAVVFHDAEGYPGQRWIDRSRRACQHAVMRAACRWTDRSIFTVPLARVPWLPAARSRAVFIPIGANLPDLSEIAANARLNSRKCVAVFGVTGAPTTSEEVRKIAETAWRTAELAGRLQLLVFGRGAKEAESALRQALQGAPLDLQIEGVVPADELSRLLVSSDVMLFVRGPISTRRGSALAGIAAGLPVAGYRGSETDAPITEAGLLLAPPGETEALASVLARALTDSAIWQEMHERSLRAHRNYFSWDVIARQYIEALRDA